MTLTKYLYNPVDIEYLEEFQYIYLSNNILVRVNHNSQGRAMSGKDDPRGLGDNSFQWLLGMARLDVT